MYATKRINKNKIDVSYISIQDPYVENRKLPPRWKEKQFAVAHLPNPENGGYFAKKTYAPDPYKVLVLPFSHLVCSISSSCFLG
mmetsp:Transcript_12370/g.22102  ORF Transcript_12370/g.22102 Transcript_12370/m.22102 type:complete len:84 (-) Transcript_12370:907-1158(-)